MRDSVKLIGLTGGIGSGKTAVSSYFEKKGDAVIDADKAAREIVTPGSPVLSELVSAFGGIILNSDGSLNRKKLASIAFNDKTLKNRMDEIMHGEILRNMRERIEKLIGSGYTGRVFIVIPLLFDINTGIESELDEIWVVDADVEKRIRRVTGRDGISRREVVNIINNQLSSEEKRKRADVVIENSGSLKELYQQLDELVKGL